MSVDNLEGFSIWQKTKDEMKTEPLELGAKMSFTVRHSLHGLLFILARYKFVAKMLSNRRNLRVLDLGCHDGIGDWLIAQNCDIETLVGIDFDEEAIAWANKNIVTTKLKFINKDFLGETMYPRGGDAVISLDVIEHIPSEKETKFVETICSNLHEHGIAIIGTPNEKMYQYANPINKVAHINNYSQERLYSLLSNYFHQVFLFGLNDEVLHTAFYPMSCYIMALCCNKKDGV